MAEELVTQAVPVAIGAATGGGGVLWVAKMMLGRMIRQYDTKHEKAETTLGVLSTRVAVAEAIIEDSKKFRTELAALQAKYEEKHAQLVAEVADLRADLFVAHERIRNMSKGDMEITKVQKPETVSKRR